MVGQVQMKRIRLAILFLIVFSILIFLIIIFRDRLLLSIGDELIVQDDLHTADVIHVIAAEDYRANYSIQLYQEGYAKYLFFTGGWCETHKYYHGAHAKQLATSKGVPPEVVFYDDSFVTSSYSETVKLKDWIDQSKIPIHSIIVVSDAYHMRRLKWTYRQVLGNEVDIQMAPVPFEMSPYKRIWWNDPISRHFVLEEYLKNVFYILRYQLSWGPLREWLAGFDRF